MTRRAWWALFGTLTAVALLFSLAVGNYVAQLHEPVERGRGIVGEWLDLSEHGYRIRVDEIAAARSYPSAWGEEETAAPESMVLVRVRSTVVPLVGPDVDLGCTLRLFNGDGEELTLAEYGVAGPDSQHCTLDPDLGPREAGAEFETQNVFVVPESWADEVYVEIHPLYVDQRAYWTVTRG